ncbi:uncharacterized protein LOC129920664 isoform X2 [Episyrphus balteatus]|uniref:uncharacterized protein LOC129920664 isoform X2 n=1 Tax=Episyrphus balteatus TaxID=286459 RepID=UPI002486AC83|nr:uncharacterized protein LOC129920664 isoform X2 [Episyrphus balteatus]
MDFYCKRKTGCLQKLCAFCCTQKRDLLRNDNFEKTIEIYPRIVILKKMKVGEVYCETITIRNTGNRGCVPAMNSILSIFTFTPPKNFQINEDDDESQFQVNTVVYLFCPIMGPQSYRVNIIGRILGPNIEITPVEINIDKLYMGQIRCIAFEILNKGPIAGEIYFKRHTDEKEINCTVTPSSVYLRPDAKKSVQLSFYRRDVGKFLTKLIFKIKSGDVLSILLRGTSLPTIVKVYPEIIEFGQIPICIPQKDSITIFNPLPVSVVVEPKIIDKGVENPLILCVDDLNLPLNTRTTTYYSKCHEEFGEEELQNCISDFGSIEESLSARTNISSKISSLFQNKVLDEIPSMTNELLQNLKSIHSQNQIEAGMKIIDESLNCILNHCDYFQELRDNKNYLKKDWKALPCDAKEVAIVEERFYLEPNKSKTLPVFLVPNSCGPSTKTIQFKVYPMGEDYSEINDTINSMHMVSTLRLQYKCMIPILEFNNDITFPQPLYVDMENSFTMYFKNIDSVPGFVYFKVIPIEQCGKITVNKNQQKFFIAPGEKAEVACSVVFRKVGNIVLHGIFQLVGKLLDHSFKIEAKLLPPEIEISTKKIFAKQEVLQLTRTRIFITNTCPSVAQFTLSLKHETHQFLEPQGASLAPNQKVLVSIFSKFLDPGLYKNILYLNLKHSDNKLIPITFSVEGIPLEFEPNIKLGLDFGTVFRNNKIQEHTINIKNLGEKAYTINFQNKISKKLEIVPKSVLNIEPKFLTIPANAQKTFNIQLDISKEIIFEEEYCVNSVDEAKHRFKLFDFEVKCIVIECKILWSKNEIRFKENGDKAVEVISLINTTHFVGNVSLNVQGYFLLGTNSTAVTDKSLDFSIQGKSSKEIYVSLNEREVDEPNLICQCLKGYIKCKVNNKTQKSLPLHVKIVNPGLRICNPKVTFFTPYADSFAHINIHNCSLKNAKFIWREIESILDKNISECNVEQMYSKTISELVLSLPEVNLPKFPNSIKHQNTEVFICDEGDESSDEENESSSLSVHDLKRKLSLMSSKTEEYSKSSTSLTTTTVHSQRSLIQRTSSCKALPISQAQVQNIGINDILENLGLLSLEPVNTICKDNGLIIGDTNCIDKKNLEESYKIGFQQKTGQISSQSMFQTYVFLPTLPEDKTLECKYGLEVFGGQTEFLDMTITNQKGRIQVSSTSINLGSNIWYKMIIDKIKITSLSPWATKITVIENDDVSNEKSSFANGFVEIISPKEFILPPKTSMNIEFKAATGLNQHFSMDIGLEINKNSTSIPINFRGSGVLPLLRPLNLTRTTQILINITENYLYLRDLYNDIQKEYIEDNKKKDDTAQLKAVGKDEIVEENEITRNKIQKRNKAREFVWLNYSEEKYPGVEHIERFLETEKLLSALNKSNDLKTTFQQFYHRCMHNRAMEFDPVVNLKLTICRPIPWEFSAFGLDMKTFKINETKTFDIELVFEGPGKLFLSCRSRAVIPGVKALFEVSQDKR